MVTFFIVSLFLNVFFGISLWIDRQVMDAMVDEILELEDLIEALGDRNEFLEEQVAVQQDAIQEHHQHQEFLREFDVAPGYTKGPWHKPEDAFQLPLI